MTRSPTFCLLGAAGYIAPRHIDAIHTVGGRLVGAVDPNDTLGVLDRYGEDVEVFSETRARWRSWMRFRERAGDPVDYVVIATPNDTHVSLAVEAMRHGADVICEKPLAVYPSDLDVLRETERATRRRVWTVLQLRTIPRLADLRERFAATASSGVHDVRVTYVTPRGPWYDRSWKGAPHRSGGVAMNIGVHLFDLLLWMFGRPIDYHDVRSEKRTTSGKLRLDRANVDYVVSIDRGHAPEGKAFRSMLVDGEFVDLSDGFLTGHAEVYRRVLAGTGFGIEDAAPAIELCARLRQ